jgi:hypothetical protein
MFFFLETSSVHIVFLFQLSAVRSCKLSSLPEIRLISASIMSFNEHLSPALRTWLSSNMSSYRFTSSSDITLVLELR